MLNSLLGAKRFCKVTPNASQLVALESLSEHYRSVGPPPPGLTAPLAFRELCRTALPYLNEDSGPMPYTEGNISLPAAGVKAIPIAGSLSAEHSDLFRVLKRGLCCEAKTKHYSVWKIWV